MRRVTTGKNSARSRASLSRKIRPEGDTKQEKGGRAEAQKSRRKGTEG